MRRYRKAHREELNAKRRENYRVNPGRDKNRNKKARIKIKAKVLKLLGGKCAACGIKDIRILTVNHLYGNGLKHRVSLGKSGRQYDSLKFYRDIANGKIDKRLFDVRCFNHNILYEYEKGRRIFPPELPTDLDDILPKFQKRLKEVKE